MKYFFSVLKTFCFSTILLLCLSHYVAASDSQNELPVKPIPQGHAHNDYLHKRPCLDALDNGFCSVEADIFLVKDMLLVGHFAFQLKPERSLESLYLLPLRERAKKYNGKIFPNTDHFYLWIDLKTDSAATYAALKKVFENYADILTRYENDIVIPGAVTIILTGSAKLALIRNEPVRYVGIDGGISALDSDIPAHLVPGIGLNWRGEFPKFKEKLTAEEKAKLVAQVCKAHEKGRKIRYWNAPDQEYFWRILVDADVDFINTDNLEPLREFLMQ